MCKHDQKYELFVGLLKSQINCFVYILITLAAKHFKEGGFGNSCGHFMCIKFSILTKISVAFNEAIFDV